MITSSLKILSAAILACGLALPGVATAAYPERDVKIIVPYGAGGNTDTIARIAARFLSEKLGQPFVVENRGGGGGTVGSGIAAAFVATVYGVGYRVREC